MSVAVLSAAVAASVNHSASSGVDYHGTQQGLLNYRLRLDVVDRGTVLDATHQSILTDIQVLHQRWSSSLESQASAVGIFEQESKFVGHVPHCQETLVADAGLQISTDFLRHYYPQYLADRTAAPPVASPDAADAAAAGTPSKRAVSSAGAVPLPTMSVVKSTLLGLGELTDKMSLLKRKEEVVDGIRRLAVALVPQFDDVVSILQRAKAAAADDGHAAAGISDDEAFKQLLLAVNSGHQQLSSKAAPRLEWPRPEHAVARAFELCHADPLALLRVDLAKSQHELTALESAAMMALEERDSCMRCEDVAGAEERSRRVADVLRSLLGLIETRFDTTLVAQSDVDEHQAQLTVFAAQVEETFAKIAHHVRQCQRASASDASMIAQAITVARERDDAARSDFDERRSLFKTALQQNTMESQAVWDEIEKRLLPKLADLASRRKTLATEFVDAVDAERMRVANSEALLVVMAKQQDFLGQFDQTMNVAAELLQGVKVFSGTECIAAARQKDFPAKLRRLTLDEAVRFYNGYKRYALTDNERRFRKQQRLENTKRMARNVQFLVKHATEALDDGIAGYRDQLRRLNATESQIQADVQTLGECLDKEKRRWDAKFVPFLNEREADYDSPELLAQQQQVALMSSLVESVDEAAAKEQSAVDQDKVALMKLQNRAVATKADWEAKRKAASNSGHAGGESSPSPSAHRQTPNQ